MFLCLLKYQYYAFFCVFNQNFFFCFLPPRPHFFVVAAALIPSVPAWHLTADGPPCNRLASRDHDDDEAKIGTHKKKRHKPTCQQDENVLVLKKDTFTTCWHHRHHHYQHHQQPSSSEWFSSSSLSITSILLIIVFNWLPILGPPWTQRSLEHKCTMRTEYWTSNTVVHKMATQYTALLKMALNWLPNIMASHIDSVFQLNYIQVTGGRQGGR